ncbi:MAG: mechanosensitive ion channel family protein [Gammaproteobacteria bacterium]|nr:mechanosensitive ion channel family protein [Gammaproteobacteria bacterium]MBU1623944.1 mechanosensitive ion channel family protein [Gammaproteobacteria bacterium]MBU1982161.1 mechanosensitive ion channel family protein [Gammaproteobacteria bacterium]
MPIQITSESMQILSVIGATLIVHFTASIGLRHAHQIAERSHNVWDDALISAARRPLPLLIWLSGITFALNLLHLQNEAVLLAFATPARIIGAEICFAWFLFIFINELSRNIVADHKARDEEVDHTTIDGLSKVSRIVVIVITALAVMQTLGFNLSGVLAFGGIGGIAVGFAAKDLLANLFGGLMLHLDRPFKIGESVRSPDKQIEGKVEYIGWRQTIIRTPNMTPVYVPNSLFSSIVVETPTRMTNRRIREVIGLRYQDLSKMRDIVAEVKAMLNAHPDIDTDQTILVAFDQFADSSLNFFIHAFTRTTEFVRFHEVKQEVLLNVADIIARHGADIAFPTRTLHMHPAA